MSPRRLLTRTSLVTVFALAALAACSEKPEAQGPTARQMSSDETKKMVSAKPTWRKQSEEAVGYSKPCRAVMSAHFERCFTEHWAPKRAVLGIAFADCINAAAGANVTCIAAGKHPDGTFSLAASPLAPP